MDAGIEVTVPQGPPAISRRVLFYGAVSALVVIGIIAAVFFLGSGEDDAQKAARLEMEQLVRTVGALIELPNEEPIVATVADPSQLADQPFFRNALKGDKVLIFNEARKAILYRPDGNLIVDVAPLSGPPAAVPASEQ